MCADTSVDIVIGDKTPGAAVDENFIGGHAPLGPQVVGVIESHLQNIILNAAAQKKLIFPVGILIGIRTCPNRHFLGNIFLRNLDHFFGSP